MWDPIARRMRVAKPRKRAKPRPATAAQLQARRQRRNALARQRRKHWPHAYRAHRTALARKWEREHLNPLALYMYYRLRYLMYKDTINARRNRSRAAVRAMKHLTHTRFK